MFDDADVYATVDHACEERFVRALQLTPSERDDIVIQTTVGIVREGPTCTPELALNISERPMRDSGRIAAAALKVSRLPVCVSRVGASSEPLVLQPSA